MYKLKGDINSFVDYMQTNAVDFFVQFYIVKDKSNLEFITDNRLKRNELGEIHEHSISRGLKTIIIIDKSLLPFWQTNLNLTSSFVFVTNCWEELDRRMRYTDMFDNTIFELPYNIDICVMK